MAKEHLPLTDKDDKIGSVGKIQKEEINAFTGGRFKSRVHRRMLREQ